ncbi:hypothetical protein NDI56_09035 [Haloarcula sp. S1CR25-12]|uniref:Uncharacterized protein n=1 Tax=Haloarcula saliterrae TaxID=2950534 RepID=A0ABU2FCU0_9EURY|nr:hypothetical protein [Haloarcula sp. S1CR25-12]MDS0259535.1 hypothetical protein [Haloarcula sp. S1CR25-12]
MGRSHHRAVLPCTLLLVLLGIAPVVGSAAPPPRPLCDACGDSFETTAERHGVSLSVERSTATVTVHGDGTATWVVRNRLAAGTDRLRSNATLRRAIAERAMWDTELRGSTVTADSVMLRYREPGFADPAPGDTLHSGEFTAAYGYRNLDGLGADRLTVVAPPGTRIDRAVPGATVADDGSRMTLTALDRGTVVTFVPRDSAVGPLWSLVALASLVGPVAVVNAVVLVGLPAVVAAATVSVVGYGRDRADARLVPELDPAGPGLAVWGAALVALSLVGARLNAGGPAMTGVGIGATVAGLGGVLGRRGVREVVSYRLLVGVAALGAGLAAAVTLVATTLVSGNSLTWSAVGSLPLLGPLFALLPAGYALERGRTDRAVLTAAAGVAVALLPAVPLFGPVTGLGWLLVPYVLGTTGLGLLLGSPLLAVGVALGRR